nr:CpsD/CapB family tyrosine-protein kinase [Clostridia bacterium]
MSKKKNKKDLYHSSLDVDVRRVIGDDTPFAVKEAYRALYTNIRYLPIEDKCKKIALTSAFPGEGKTSISVNLAYTLAINSPESRILLIDCDMRSPRVAELLEIDASRLHGLSEFLAGIVEAPNVQRTKHPNLSFLSSGATNANTPGLLSSSKMQKLMDYCNENYDYVIIDTPPVNVVSDAILLSSYINGYILATRADFSDTSSVSDAIETLNKAEANILGTVLCSYNAKSGKGYGSYKYGKYGRYGYGRYAKYGSYYDGND